jgi:polar amino acid transport system substrate-binding protein
VPEAKIVGQFQAPGGNRWGMLLQKGSKLTPCIDEALKKVSDSGRLKQLQDQWMGGDAAPALS